jgi:hypothetical protein
MRVSYFVLLAALMASPCASQTTAYQSADGLSSVYIQNAKSNLTYNVSDTKFDIGFLHEPPDAPVNCDLHQRTHPLIVGLDITGKPSSDVITQFFQSGNAPPAIGVSGSLGTNQLLRKPLQCQEDRDHARFDAFLTTISVTGSTFKTIPNATATTATTQHFYGFSVLPTYDIYLNAYGANILLGFAAGINRTNNVSNLTSVNLTTTNSTTTTGTTSVSVTQQQTVYQGTYTTAIGAPLYSDFVVIPNFAPWLSFDAFMRSNLVPANRFAEGGLGLFLAQPGKAEQVLGGLSLGWKDGARTIAVVGGWTF